SRERKKQRIEALPGDLSEALEAFDKSLVARAALGEHMFSEFMSAKRKEWDSFRTYVSKWELDKYLERY
ncbi:type I glutamate--ammonia ligase, partial [bacterium]|nr:type I glutamate--ammonia ligase [bacterium]